MDRMSDSGSDDGGSNPFGNTKSQMAMFEGFKKLMGVIHCVDDIEDDEIVDFRAFQP